MTRLKPFDLDEFNERADRWRYVITDMICRAGSGHLGGALSLVETVMTLYYRVMRIDPGNPDWPERDRLVVSKGHAGPVVYIALAELGYFPESWLGTLNADGTRLPSHCDQRQTPGIDMTTGSLGQGLSCACGLALAARMDRKDHRIYCILGDGESQEGQIWEAAMFAAQHKLDNLVAITDYNKLQIDAFLDDIVTLEPLVDKWRAFGWEVFETDGHDWDGIFEALTKAGEVKGKPAMVIAHTLKGRGCKAIENKPEGHNIKVADRAAYEMYINSLECQEVTLPY
jgi:transketolase